MNRMRTLLAILLLSVAVNATAEPRFMAVDVYVETRAPLAAWQFEISDKAGAIRVVGIENGDAPVFHAAPYYDREAVAGGRADRPDGQQSSGQTSGRGPRSPRQSRG